MVKSVLLSVVLCSLYVSATEPTSDTSTSTTCGLEEIKVSCEYLYKIEREGVSVTVPSICQYIDARDFSRPFCNDYIRDKIYPLPDICTPNIQDFENHEVEFQPNNNPIFYSTVCEAAAEIPKILERKNTKHQSLAFFFYIKHQ
ncbi:hypothetical protein EDC96DRAFT_530880 [Choanephora cucurbitarum]|nr:hypothetical protein EDC96DRAFT_530880 [Choanephora cucurbitarum]